MVAVTLKNTAVYPMVETFTVDPTYVYDSNAVPMASPPVPAPAFVMGNVAPDSPAMLTFTPPVAKTTPGQYSVTGKAAWEAAGGSQGFTMSFTAPDGTKATTSTVAGEVQRVAAVLTVSHCLFAALVGLCSNQQGGWGRLQPPTQHRALYMTAWLQAQCN